MQDLLLVNPPRKRRRRHNPRGISWSGIFARPKSRKSGKRRRLVRIKAGRRRGAFALTKRIGRRVTAQFARDARRALRRGCRSALGRSMLKCRRYRRGRKGGKLVCFKSHGKRKCFRVRK